MMNADYKDPFPPAFVDLSLIFYAFYVFLHVALLALFSDPSDLSDAYSAGANTIIKGLSSEAGK
jgi:hypothetical protein